MYNSTPSPLASQKIAIAEKSLRFQIAKCKIASFSAEIAEESPENRRGNRRKIAAISWGAEQKSQRSAFSNRSVFGTLSHLPVRLGLALSGRVEVCRFLSAVPPADLFPPPFLNHALELVHQLFGPWPGPIPSQAATNLDRTAPSASLCGPRKISRQHLSQNGLSQKWLRHSIRNCLNKLKCEIP